VVEAGGIIDNRALARVLMGRLDRFRPISPIGSISSQGPWWGAESRRAEVVSTETLS
jgi:hypothetical protein